MNTKKMQDKAQRKQAWNTGFPDIAAPSRVLSSKILFELVELIGFRFLFAMRIITYQIYGRLLDVL